MEHKGKKGRRYLVFMLGVVVSAIGIAFLSRAGIGTSPMSGVPFVLSLVTAPSMGVYTFIVNAAFLILEAAVRKKFTVRQAIQLPITLGFSVCIDLALRVIPSQYGGPYLNSVIFLMIGCFTLALGVALEVLADVIMLPGEAFVRAVAQKLDKPFGNVEVVNDSVVTGIAIVISLVSFHKLNGVREGTIVSALLVGHIVKFYTARLRGPVSRFLGTEEASRLPSAEDSGEYLYLQTKDETETA